MKKIINNLKGKKVLSFVLAAIMLVTTFSVAVPMLKMDVGAAEIITIDGVSQTPIVTKDNAKAILDIKKYDEYAANYLGGAGYSTGIVIPGLVAAQDYVIQGMTYYPKKDWFLVTAYHNTAKEETAVSSKIFCLDASTGKFVAMISFLNPDDSVNYDHGGGIAVSENNLYYSCGDKDRTIAYVPLSELDKVEENTHAQIKLKGKHDFVEIGSVADGNKTAYSAYVCYDEGVLWMGNFFDSGADFIGITIAAADYNCRSNNTYNSMVFGYRLSGSTSEEEWANLTGSKGKDCQGSPSYALGLNNALKDVQYATVHEGKLYLSRSYGSGTGNSIRFGFGETSFLTIADIDLSQPGDRSIKISTKSTGSLDKDINAYDISNYHDYPMMPMSEGLCVVDDEIFITFEGASNKYLNESSGATSIGNCEKPVDVIWQLDPYALMEQKVAEPEKSVYYEKVNSLSEIENGAEYIIVHQSPEIDPVTQKQILYALNADGNFKGYKLSKGTSSAAKGYNGMIGHAITDYDLFDDNTDGSSERLYLNNPDKDDVENIRWTLTRGNDRNYRLTTTEPYFANCNNLYFDKNTISMLPGNATKLAEIKLQESNNGKGGFWLANNDAYFLWCNDGDYNATINTYYENNKLSTPIYDGLSEQPGTFHCDALNKTDSNIIGESVPDANSYSDSVFYIFKRKVDDVASTYESRVFTDLNAVVQADGTYTIDLETYAISPNHYKYVGEKPTDYIIVADTSSSMESKDGTKFIEYPGNLTVASFFTSKDMLEDDKGEPQTTTGSENGTPVIGYAFAKEDLYYLHDDGNYYRLYMALRNNYEYHKAVDLGFLGQTPAYWTFISNHFYVYYISNDGKYHCFANETEAKPSYTYTEEQFKNWVEKEDISKATGKATKSITNDAGNRYSKAKFPNIPHYRFDNANSSNREEGNTRINTLKYATSNLIEQIAAENPKNKIALVQFGGSTGFYPNTSSTLSTDDYANAFWSAGNASGLQTIASNLTTTTQTKNNIAFPIVNEIIAKSGATYVGENSTRNVAVIYLSDGVAGADSKSDEEYEAAANEIIPEALNTKKAGAFIYTVMIGADGAQYGRTLFMEAVSSKYAEAKSMAELGGQSVDGVNYALSLAAANTNTYANFGEVVLKETSKNNAVGIDSLDNLAFIRQELNDCFNYDNADCSVELITGRFDAIGRFEFDKEGVPAEKNGVTVNLVDGKRHLTITGYNYADEYIGKGKEGRMLRVRIEGVLPKNDAVIQHEPISNVDTTAVYESEDDMKASTAQNDLSFKKLPKEYANINEYTYVLDYGLQMIDTDVNGTLCAVSNAFSVQDAENNYKNAKTALDGDIAIQSGDENLLYSMSPDVGTTNHIGYTLIKRPEGNYEWFKIKLVPASNVLFEENVLTAADKSDNEWDTAGKPSNKNQSLSDDNDRYGYDEAYANNGAGYSNGTAYKATVNSSTKRSGTMKFSYTGTGFDLMASCGPSTGIQMVNIKDSSGKIEKLLIVDTYYNGDYIDANYGTLNQVPVVSYTNTGGYGTYNVEVTAAYLSTAQGVTGARSVNSNPLFGGIVNAFSGKSNGGYSIQSLLDDLDIDVPADEVELVWFDDNSILNGGTGPASTGSKARSTTATAADVSLDCYIDSVRVYNPLGDDTTNYIASEKGAQYYNIIDELADTENGALTSTDSLFAYVTGALDPDKNGTTLSFENYQAVGPQHEVYLEKATGVEGSHAVSFNVTVPDSSSRVMISLRAVDGATTAKVASGSKAIDFAINTATEQYFDITPYLNIDTTTGIANVIITNIGDGLLSVNNLKVVGGGIMPLSDEDLPVMAMSLAAESRTVDDPNAYDYDAPVVEEDVQEPETDAPAEDDTPEADEPVADVPMDLTSIIKMLLKFIETIILKFF